MIFVSPGHYPARPGAVWDHFAEHDEALVWCRIIGEQLNGLCIEHLEVPGDVLRNKVQFINHRSESGDLAVEIHFNAARDADNNPVGRGSESLYFPGSAKGMKLARYIQDYLGRVLPPDRGAKEGWYRMNPNNGPDYFLAKTDIPAVIVEPEFIHRRSEIIAARENGCKAIVRAIEQFLNEEQV